MVKIFKIKCPDYNPSNISTIKKTVKTIDEVIIDNFNGKDVVIRAVQSAKHDISKDELIQKIVDTGSDRYGSDSKNAKSVNDKPIDLFGYACKVDKPPFTLSILEGFHRWKPMSLEVPQRKADIWMIYDANQLINVEYNHSYYHVKAHDGYLFKDTDNKNESLLGLIVIE